MVSLVALDLQTGRSWHVATVASAAEVRAYVDALRIERRATRNDRGEYSPIIHGLKRPATRAGRIPGNRR